MKRALSSQRRWKHILLVREVRLFFVCLILLSIWAVWWTILHHSEEGLSQTNYRFVDSKYRNIRTKITRHESAAIQSIVEYPITSNERVNQTIAHYIDTRNLAAALRNQPTDGMRQPLQQHITYQVVRHTERYLSIVVTSYQQTRLTHPLQSTEYWTFDMSHGDVITLGSLFSNEDDGKARLALYIAQKLHKNLAPLHGYDESIALPAIYRRLNGSFIWEDNRNLRFDFDRGEVATPHFEPQSVVVSIDSLQLFMQTTTASKLFHIGSVERIPELAMSDTKTTNCARTKCLALTYDDGPGPYTSELLAILERYRARASFFLVGKSVEKHPQLVKDISRHGHTIGSHGWEHRSMTTQDEKQVMRTITKTNELIAKLTTKPVTYVRPPNGAIDSRVYSALRITASTGMLWSLDTRDWAARDRLTISARVISAAKPGGIVILHDTNKKSVDATEDILRTLSREGYRFVSLDELLGPNPAPGRIIYGVE